MAAIVTAAALVAKTKDGSEVYLYRQTVVPETVSEDEIGRLADLGLVEREPDAKPDAAPSTKGK